MSKISRFKAAFLFLIFSILFCLSGCQKEEVPFEENLNPSFSATIFQGDSVLRKNKKIFSHLKSFGQKNQEGNGVYSGKYNFSIDTSRTQIIKSPFYSSFTFNVKASEVNDEILENYVVTYFNSGEVVQYLIKYPIIKEGENEVYDILNAYVQILDDPE